MKIAVKDRQRSNSAARFQRKKTVGEQKRKVEFGEAAGGGEACSQQVPKSSEHENNGKR